MSLIPFVNREEVIWAAGLFEGEGCFCLNGRGGVTAAINMTDKDAIDRFHEAVGFGRRMALKPAKIHWKPSWKWITTNFEEVQALYAAFYPWLCSRRRARGQELIAAVRGRVVSPAVCKRGHRYDEVGVKLGHAHGRIQRQCLKCYKNRPSVRPR